MTESDEIGASREEVERFVGKLSEFHDSLPETERAMLGTILESAQATDTGGYGLRAGFNRAGLVEFLAAGEDTQGFRVKFH